MFSTFFEWYSITSFPSSECVFSKPINNNEVVDLYHVQRFYFFSSYIKLTGVLRAILNVEYPA